MPDAVVNRVREVREGRGEGLRELARAVGISPAYLHDIEHGRRCPAPDVAERINSSLHAEAIVLPPTAEELEATIDALRTRVAEVERERDRFRIAADHALTLAYRGDCGRIAEVLRIAFNPECRACAADAQGEE